MRAWVLGCAAIVAVACSSNNTNSGFGTGGPGGGGGGGGGGDGGLFGGGGDGGRFGDDGGGNQNGCSGQAANFVYVLSQENDLYSFKPDKKQFTKIGHLGCATQWQPNSMAIDRNAVAWVNYVQADPTAGMDSAGGIFKVSTKDASCEPGPAIQLPPGWFRLGMGYSTDGANTTNETLYVAATASGQGGSSQGLGKINFAAKSVAPIGPFTGSLAGQSGELTGTGDGRLFGFFTTTPVQVAEVDKPSGAIKSSKQLAQVETPAAWAFSFWGGKFYLYTAPDPTLQPNRTSNVTEYDPTNGSANPSYMTNVGFRIVGAGVSTCAPVTPPQ